MLVKLTAEQIAKLGAKDPTDATTKLAAFFLASAQLETVMAEQPTIASLVTRMDALEKLPRGISAEDAKALFATESIIPIKTFLAGAEGKQLIGAEASRITMEALAGISTMPVKPAPAAAVTNNAEQLEAAGEYEKAFAASKDLRAEFDTWQQYAAFAKANKAGRITFNRPDQKPATV